MSRGVYTVSFDQQSFTTANGDHDFFEITPADDKPIEIISIKVSNKSEVGDAQEEFIAWSVVRANATTGNGSSATPAKTDPSDGVASFTAEVVATTPASTGSPVTLMADTFNVRQGLYEIHPPEMRFKASQADTMICVRLLTALADDATFSGTIWVREL
jgi:hypothetical protein